MALFVTLLGVSLGWLFGGGRLGYSEVGLRSFFSFSSAFMWFLVIFSTQVLLSGGLRKAGGFLFWLDRGWLEIFGGQGRFRVVLGGSQVVQGWQGRGILVHSGLFLILGVLSFLLFVR